MKTMYKYKAQDKVQILLCTDNSATSFIADFKQVMEGLMKTHEAMATPRTLFSNFSATSQNLVCEIGGCRPEPPPINITLLTVVVSVVSFDRMFRMLMGG